MRSDARTDRCRLLVTGANGHLGRRVCRLAAPRWQVHAMVGPHGEDKDDGSRVRCDIRDRAAVEAVLLGIRPDSVIHTAAINPGGPEQEMATVNVRGSQNVASACAAVSARLIHVSTDVVHDGTRAPYGDTVEPTPLYLYARTKAEAEGAVLDEHADAVVVRSSLIYSLDEMDRATAGLASRLAAGDRIMLFSDSLRQPIWVETLAEALLGLAATDRVGTVNVAGEQVLGRELFVRKMLTFWGVDHEGRSGSVRVEELDVPHPRDLRLCLDRARRWLGMSLPGVDEVLERHS